MKRSCVGFVGAGRAATGLARALRGRGYRITGFSARHRASAARAAKRLGLTGARTGAKSLADILRGTDILMVCVPDEEITAVAEALGSIPAPGVRGKIVLHTSGVSGAGPLRGLRERGAKVGSLHPLVSFPPLGASAAEFRDVLFALDGDGAAVRTARAMVQTLGGVPLAVPEADRPIYHLAAALIATGTAALLDVGIQLASRRLRLSEPKTRAALISLARSVLRNLARHGARASLTGPVARGDWRTVERHIEALRHEEANVRELYLLLSRHALEMAVSDGRLDAADAKLMRKRLRHH